MKQSMQNQTSELYTDDKKNKFSSSPNDIFNTLYQTQPPKLLLLIFLAKVLTKKNLKLTI